MPVLLRSAVGVWREFDAFAKVKKTDSARSVELMRGCGQHIDSKLMNVKLHVTDCLNRVRVEKRVVRVRDYTEFFDRLNAADLIVGEHNRHKSRAVRNVVF